MEMMRKVVMMMFVEGFGWEKKGKGSPQTAIGVLQVQPLDLGSICNRTTNSKSDFVGSGSKTKELCTHCVVRSLSSEHRNWWGSWCHGSLPEDHKGANTAPVMPKGPEPTIRTTNKAMQTYQHQPCVVSCRANAAG